MLERIPAGNLMKKEREGTLNKSFFTRRFVLTRDSRFSYRGIMNEEVLANFPKLAEKPSQGQRVKLADVARRAGVHSATASQVLNGRSNCWASEKTRERIFDAARALGYRPNLAARSLRLGRTQLFGLIFPGLSIGSSQSRVSGFSDGAEDAGYTVTLSSHSNEAKIEDRVIRRLVDRGVDGLAVYPVDRGPHKELRRLCESGFPVVTFDGSSLLDFECDDVSVDYDQVGRTQARHVLELGRRRICLANTKPEARIMTLLEAAIRDELARRNAPRPLEMRLPISIEHEVEEVETLEGPMREFLRRHCGEFDALLGNDTEASLAVRLLGEMGVRVPQDVAIIGGGTTLLATYGWVPLTAVVPDNVATGARALRLLVDRIEGRVNGDGFRRITAPANLVVRQSSYVENIYRKEMFVIRNKTR